MQLGGGGAEGSMAGILGEGSVILSLLKNVNSAIMIAIHLSLYHFSYFIIMTSRSRKSLFQDGNGIILVCPEKIAIPLQGKR